MTPTRRTSGTGAERSSAWSDTIWAQIGNYETLSSMSWASLATLEIFPGIRLGSPIWIMPANQLPAGASQRESFRTLTPRIRASSELTELGPEDESLCRALLALSSPRATLTGIRTNGPSTWLGRARKTIKLARCIVENFAHSDGTLWSHINRDQWKTVIEMTSAADYRRQTLALVQDLAGYGERGLLSDFPNLHNTGQQALLSRQSAEPSRRGISKREPVTKKPKLLTEPFSDEFVTAVLTRAIWLQDNLALQVIDCWAQLREHAAVAAQSGRTTSNPRTIKERRAIIANFPWTDAHGTLVTTLPWEIKFGRQNEVTAAWPPRDAVSISVMVGIIQALNFCTVSFCDGARSSENLDVDDNSIHDEDAGRVTARTFKYEPSPGGKDRDWPLHPRGRKALEIQQRIAKVIRPDDSSHLWMLLTDGAEPAGSPLRNATEPIVEAIKKLGLTALAGAKRPHAHRWRHTIARLIALCVAAAPQVLMDLFGHRDLEITLHYILSNPSIAEEVQRIAAEISYALAEEAICDVEAGSAGGPAAEPLREGLNGLKMRRGQEELGADTMSEAIAILTFNGKLWASVREGVLCTKGLGQFGPCTRGSGAPDPGNCRTDCDHRLELARAKANCLRALRALLRDRDQAVASGADLQVVYFDGQILAQLKRWPDIRNQTIADSPVARAIWDGRLLTHDA